MGLHCGGGGRGCNENAEREVGRGRWGGRSKRASPVHFSFRGYFSNLHPIAAIPDDVAGVARYLVSMLTGIKTIGLKRAQHLDSNKRAYATFRKILILIFTYGLILGALVLLFGTTIMGLAVQHPVNKHMARKITAISEATMGLAVTAFAVNFLLEFLAEWRSKFYEKKRHSGATFSDFYGRITYALGFLLLIAVSLTLLWMAFSDLLSP